MRHTFLCTAILYLFYTELIFHPDKSVCKPGFEIYYVIFVRFAGRNFVHSAPAIRIAEGVEYIVAHRKVKAVFVDGAVYGI